MRMAEPKMEHQHHHPDYEKRIGHLEQEIQQLHNQVKRLQQKLDTHDHPHPHKEAA